MRKIKMKRKSSKKEKSDYSSEEENGVEESRSESENNAMEDVEDCPSEKSDEQPLKKRKKGDKRKSVSFSPKKGGKKKEAEPVEPEEEDEEESQYEVESILEQKNIKGVRHYLIRWKGYEQESDTWEPEDTLNCPDIIKKFLASSGNDNGEKSKKDGKSKKKGGPSSKPKSERKKEKVEDWDSDEEFEVERIIEVHHKRNGGREFLVSWKGYSGTDNSWEPEENLDCADLIAKFMDKVEQARVSEQKDLRVNRTPTARFTLATCDGGRRLSRRLGGKQRIHYHDAE